VRAERSVRHKQGARRVEDTILDPDELDAREHVPPRRVAPGPKGTSARMAIE